jgi:hypothetical protein
MPSPLYQQFQPQNNLLGMIAEFRNNPVGMLSRKYNLPSNMNDPQQIVQHLLNTGQITQGQIDNAMRSINNPQIRQLFK